ncbi:hypothetical protein R3P38DRAFT_3511864 [Favolaschia claudopus]|uniref:SBP-type domain-containing protein n=1 Tax=Favolaschia claudopus TaxID=2862362 RepID=A0AAV9Z2I5_9AGAR
MVREKISTKRWCKWCREEKHTKMFDKPAKACRRQAKQAARRRTKKVSDSIPAREPENHRAQIPLATVGPEDIEMDAAPFENDPNSQPHDPSPPPSGSYIKIFPHPHSGMNAKIVPLDSAAPPQQLESQNIPPPNTV